MSSRAECTVVVDHNVYSAIECHESHLFQPRRQNGGAPEDGVVGGGELDGAAARPGRLPHQPYLRPPADAQTVIVRNQNVPGLA
jgi:hypothetical protein